MVTGDHNRSDARLTAGTHGIGYFLSGRVDHSGHTHKSHVKFYILIIICRQLREGAHGKAKHTQGTLRHGKAKFCNVFFVSLRDRPHTFRSQNVSTQGQHFIHRTLGIRNPLFIDAVNSGHPLTLGIKRLLKKAGIFILQGFMVNSKRLCHIDQRALCGVSDDFSLSIRVKTGVIAESRCINQFFIYRRMLFDSIFNRGSRTVFKISVDRNVCYRHLIECKSTGFIGTNNGGAAQGFHRRQFTNQCIFLSHTLHAQGHYNRGCSRQTFRDDGDCQRNRNQELRNQRTLIKSTDSEDQGADD